jgi:peptidyl-prolyl cis-trans isomerase D
MFKTFRTALVIAIIVSAAVALSAQLKTNPKGVVGKIGNKTYTLAEYKEILDNYYRYYESREGRLSSERKKELNERCWEELIGRAIYDGEIRRRRLSVSDQEAMNLVLKTPPVQVQQIEALKTEGKFDLEKFKQAMEMDANFKNSVLELVKEGMIYDKLFDTIRAQVKAKPDSVRDAWIKDNNTADARIIMFDWSKLPEMPVQNSETISYYNQNRENYRREPARKYRFVKLTAAAMFKPKADSIYNAIKQGADFAQLAMQFSDDPGSGQNGGDLGWFGKGRMVKPFEDAAFALDINQVSEPVQSQFGWHIIQTLEKRTTDTGEPEVHARHILVKTDATDEMKSILLEQADLFSLAVKEKGLVRAAMAMDLKVEETNDFYEKDRGIREIGQFPELISSAFSNHLGYVPANVTGRSGEVFVCELSDSLGVHYAPLEKEKNNIVRLLEREKRIAANKQRARDFFDMHAGEDYIAIAERDSMKIVDANGIKDGASIPEIGQVKPLTEALLSTEQGLYTPVVENEQNAFLALVTSRNKADLKKWDKEKNRLIADASDKLKSNHMNTWYYQQRQKMTIEDNRKEYFELPAPKMGSQQIQLNPQ